MWSSYNQYILGYEMEMTCIDAELIKGYYAKQKEYERYMNETNNDECLDFKLKKKYTDDELRSRINKEFKISKKEIDNLTAEEKNRIIKNIYNNMTISIRQLGRVLGIGKNIIEKAIK